LGKREVSHHYGGDQQQNLDSFHNPFAYSTTETNDSKSFLARGFTATWRLSPEIRLGSRLGT
jgi:hypothetical protein